MAEPARLLREETTTMTPEEYLAFERASLERHKYWGGQLYLMSGASRSHNLISVNLVSALHAKMRGGPCEVYTHDMRVRLEPEDEADDAYSYPDVVVACGEPQFADGELDMLLNPILVIEVLSPSTELYDRGRKAKAYRDLPSLRELVLVSQDAPHVEAYRRGGDGFWVLQDVHGLEATLELTSVDCRLPLAEIYERVKWEPAPPRVVTVRP